MKTLLLSLTILCFSASAFAANGPAKILEVKRVENTPGRVFFAIETLGCAASFPGFAPVARMIAVDAAVIELNATTGHCENPDQTFRFSLSADKVLSTIGMDASKAKIFIQVQ